MAADFILIKKTRYFVAHRIRLEPSKETDTYDRDNFSIHGGWFSGSAGCIDLTSQIDNFVALFGFIGKDLIVNVQY